MFVRIQSHKRKNGTSVSGFALAESRRVNGKPRIFTLLNLGSDFAIPEDLWPDFGKQVKAHMKGTSSLKNYTPEFQEKVIKTADQLQASGYEVDAKPNQRHWVIPEQMSHPDSRTVGGERVCLKALELMGFAELLLELGFSQRQMNLARVLVVGRMLSPGSEKHTYEWMVDESSILELLRFDKPCLSALYLCADLLQKHRRTLTGRLFSTTQELLGFGHTLIFYDLSNTYYHGQKRGRLLNHGRSKEKRSNCPLVTLALTINEAGFPCNVDILPGNVGEPKTLQANLESLPFDEMTIIMDAGISSRENLAYLDEQGFSWITVDRGKTPAVPKRKPDKTFKTASGVNLRAWRVNPDEQEDKSQQSEESSNVQEESIEEQFVYVHSEAKQGKEQAILESRCTEFETALQDLHVGLSTPKRMKTFHLVEKKVGRLVEEFKSVSHLYEVTVTLKKGSNHAESVIYRRTQNYEDRQSAIGGYVLRTSLTDWEIQDIVRHYHRLTEIEATFRMMKSDLGLRPIYHKNDERIEGHMFITVLAYHAAHLARTLLKQNHIHHSWDTIRKHLNGIRRITTKLPKTKQSYLLTRMDEALSPFVEDIANCIDLNYDPNGTRTIQERTE